MLTANVEVNTDWSDAQTNIVARYAPLRQAVENVIVNAIDAMPQGGTLELRTSYDDSGGVIEIADSGVGMPSDIKNRVFDLHFTTKETGTGIGLYVAKALIEDAGGQITVSSALGEGSVFRIWIPTRPDSNGNGDVADVE